MRGLTDLSPSQLAELRGWERRGEPFLVYRDAAGALRFESLAEAKRVAIGRGAESDVVLAWDSVISRTHALLELVGGEWTLLDEGLSRNGSFANGERVRGRRRLVDGDVLGFGSTTVLFCAPKAAASDAVVETDRAADAATLAELTPAQRRVLVALCRPLASRSLGATPASNRDIAAELTLSLDGVRTQMRALFEKLEVPDLPQNRKRAELARRALDSGLVTEHQLLEPRAGR